MVWVKCATACRTARVFDSAGAKLISETTARYTWFPEGYMAAEQAAAYGLSLPLRVELF